MFYVAIPMLFPLTILPRNSTFSGTKCTFSASACFEICIQNRFRTDIRLCRWSSKLFPMASISSRKANTVFQVRPLITRSITRENVAGLFLIPKPILTCSNKPNLVRNECSFLAVFRTNKYLEILKKTDATSKCVQSIQNQGKRKGILHGVASFSDL